MVNVTLWNPGDLDMDAMGDMDSEEEPKMDLDSEEGGTEGEP